MKTATLFFTMFFIWQSCEKTEQADLRIHQRALPGILFPQQQRFVSITAEEEEEENEEEDDRFPHFTFIPANLRFSCRDRTPGFYADPQTGCQVYHQCLLDGRRYSFICGKSTIFNQKSLVCDHWYNYNCEDAALDAEENSRTFIINQEFASSTSV